MPHTEAVDFETATAKAPCQGREVPIGTDQAVPFGLDREHEHHGVHHERLIGSISGVGLILHAVDPERLAGLDPGGQLRALEIAVHALLDDAPEPMSFDTVENAVDILRPDILGVDEHRQAGQGVAVDGSLLSRSRRVFLRTKLARLFESAGQGGRVQANGCVGVTVRRRRAFFDDSARMFAHAPRMIAKGSAAKPRDRFGAANGGPAEGVAFL